MFYRVPIILFGFVFPLLVCAIILGGGSFLKNKATSSFKQKQRLYKAAEAERTGSLSIEAQVSKKKPYMDRWNEQLEKEAANAIAANLKQISDTLPPKEFQQTAVEYPNGKAGFASLAAQDSAQVKLAFRGTFRSVQQAFAELESRMPQLQLHDLKIDPSGSSNATLNFQVTYTAWKK